MRAPRPAVSPDGRWLAYGSNRSGAFEVYVQPPEGEGAEIRISAEGGSEPLWSPDGSELSYRAGPGAGSELVAATISTTPRLTVGECEVRFPMDDIASGTPHTNHDVSPGGRTFTMVRFNPASRIMVIQNPPELVTQLETGTR